MTKLRIGVDARPLSGVLTGIGRYTFKILSRLVSQDYEFILYSHKPIIHGDWNAQLNVTVKTMNLSSRISRMLWAQTILPLQASLDRLDLFWSPSHRLPQFLPHRIAKVVTIHDLVWKHAGETMRPLSRYLDSILMPQAALMADQIIAVSNSTASDLMAEVPKSRFKIQVIPLASLGGDIIDAIETPEKYFLFVGTLEPRKNLERLLEAFSKVNFSMVMDIKLVIVGGHGWGNVNVENWINKYNLRKRVVVMGYVSESELSFLYKNSMFLVMPSLYEGFGLPIIEAMFYGKPILTSNISSMPEVAGDAAILVDPKNVDSIAKGLELLFANNALRKELSVNAINQSLKYSWDMAASKTIDVFHAAIRASIN